MYDISCGMHGVTFLFVMRGTEVKRTDQLDCDYAMADVCWIGWPLLWRCQMLVSPQTMDSSMVTLASVMLGCVVESISSAGELSRFV